MVNSIIKVPVRYLPSLKEIKDIVDNLQTYDELLNMVKEIKNSSLKFKNLILNYITNSDTDLVIDMEVLGKFSNKYLKYKKKYINLKKIKAINK